MPVWLPNRGTSVDRMLRCSEQPTLEAPVQPERGHHVPANCGSTLAIWKS